MEISVKYFYGMLGWVLWCTLHSALISTTVTEYLKKRLGPSFRFYRLFYGVVSLTTLLPLLYYVNSIRPAPFFRWDGILIIIQYSLLLAGIYLFIAGGRHYSWATLLGISQIRAEQTDSPSSDGDTFAASGIHNVIRHPWYLAGIMIVWAQDLSLPVILNNIVISVYFIVGSFLEERKLVLEFGEKYREYQRTVSMLVPYRWLKTRIEEVKYRFSRNVLSSIKRESSRSAPF
jgi:methanethiol S-methyltransferase